MDNTKFIVIENARLNFLDSNIVVKEYIEKRLNNFGVKDIQFTSSSNLKKTIEVSANKKDYLVILNIMNPIIDVDLVCKMTNRLKNSGAKFAFVDGAIPGTQVEYVIAPNVSEIPSSDKRPHDSILVRHFTQDKYNNQFNLYKYKRLKMFLFLLKEIEDMHKLNIETFIERLAQEEIFNKLAAFGEDVKMHTHTKCPHCNSEITPIPMRMSQPFCGYLPTSRPLYHACEKCELVVISPYIDADSTSVLYDKFDKQDFVMTHTNIYQKGAIRCDFSSFEAILPSSPVTLDIGGGMGGFSKFLKQTYPKWDVTHSDFKIKQNKDLEKLNIKTKAINFLTEPIGHEVYDLISAWEVLEHIPYEKLDYALKNIYDALRPGGIFLFSTPDFDSPLCKCNDFFAICPPFHYLVFGQKWLKQYFSNKPEWDIASMRANSDFLSDSTMWCDYASQTAPSAQLRALASILSVLLEDEKNKNLLIEHNMGTEVVTALIKKQ